MPKPLKFPTKLLIGFDDSRLSAIDAWRRQQEDMPSRSEAIRRLVDARLTDEAASKPASSSKAKPRSASRPGKKGGPS